MSKKYQEQKAKEAAKAQELARKPKVKMRFKEDKYYNDVHNPLYRAGEIVEVEARMVDRWLKRGGEIIGQGSERNPVSPKVEEKKVVVDSKPKEPVEHDEEKVEDESKPESEDSEPIKSGNRK